MANPFNDLSNRAPARYVPFEDGRYHVKAGLRHFGFDFGNGEADRQLFQIDRQFPDYRQAKLAARAEQLERYVLQEKLSPIVEAAVMQFLTRRLVADHPRWFSLETDTRAIRLLCRLTGRRLDFDANWRITPDQTRPPYTGPLDALACQVQEDFAIVSVEGRRHWTSALHVCLPSHWAPESRIGMSFAQLHQNVPGMEGMLEQQAHHVEHMIGATEGLVRFVWGIQRDGRLNGHPRESSAPTDRFDPDRDMPHLRIERQVIWGLPESRASIFAIRPYLQPLSEIRRHRPVCDALIKAIGSMSNASATYKGLASWRDDLIGWLS